MEQPSEQSGVVKYSLILAGFLLIIIGAIGIVVPGLPTTIFLIGAAACFAKSSPCLHAWLLSHTWFGPVIKDWQQNKSIPKKAKVIALISMLLACIYTWFVVPSTWLIFTIYAVMIFPFIYVSRLPLSESLKNEPAVADSAESVRK
ncbi:MAG: YbaN family protein [Kangiellaceae bacterium]|nr:YbaN family protein [Kangiellaceae bacterium]MCW9000787.1 YbaN family protein [Kangiellaceae bacterium]